MWETVIVDLTSVFAILITIGLINRWRRKPMLTLGSLAMVADVGVLDAMMHIDIHSPSMQYFVIAMLLMFIVDFAMSAGSPIWVLCPEIQPPRGYDFGTTCFIATSWVTDVTVDTAFLAMLNTLGNVSTFQVYVTPNVLFILLILQLTPEIKHVSLEHTERNLTEGRKLREIGAHD